MSDEQRVHEQDAGSGPFEGPEKLLEIWFEQNPPKNDDGNARTGLRTVDRVVWEEMLDIVKCKVLSVINGRDMDAYLLSESSFFVFPNKLILKTCGTTLNLLGLPRILAIAKQQCGYDKVWRCFYSRKSFMFPERQVGPHREWRNEVEYLDALFENGAAYTVGKVNGDHWLLYLTTPPDEEQSSDGEDDADGEYPDRMAASMASSIASSDTLPSSFHGHDYTIELLMTKLAAPARRPFFFLEEDIIPSSEAEIDASTDSCSHKGALVSSKLGIDSLFPASQTRLDSYAFEPCGYSANALVDAGEEYGGEGYYTIHVTPEEGWSYASFECNVAVKPAEEKRRVGDVDIDMVTDDTPEKPRARGRDRFPDLETLIQRVVNIFQPGHVSLTLFVSSSDMVPSAMRGDTDASETLTSVESAQKAFRQALAPRGYRRTDKINYELGGYDLAFATFQKK